MRESKFSLGDDTEDGECDPASNTSGVDPIRGHHVLAGRRALAGKDASSRLRRRRSNACLAVAREDKGRADRDGLPVALEARARVLAAASGAADGVDGDGLLAELLGAPPAEGTQAVSQTAPCL